MPSMSRKCHKSNRMEPIEGTFHCTLFWPCSKIQLCIKKVYFSKDKVPRHLKKKYLHSFPCTCPILPVMSACICTKRGFLLSPPHRNSVLMSCPAACITSKICLVPNFKKGGEENRTRWAQESSHRNRTTPAWQRHPHPNLLFTSYKSICKSSPVKRFQFWSQVAKQNKKRTANKKTCFLSFQQKRKAEEFCIGLTISLGLCPMQNKMFHFMAGLIET